MIFSGDRIVLNEEVQMLTGIKDRTRLSLEKRGEFPRRRQISAHLVGWLWSEIQEWVASRPVSRIQPPRRRGEGADARAA